MWCEENNPLSYLAPSDLIVLPSARSVPADGMCAFTDEEAEVSGG